jgi:hypothetical protein
MSTPAARRDASPSVPCPRDSARRGPAGSPDLHDVHDTLSFLHPTQAIYLSASRPTRCGSSPFLARRVKPDPISNPHLPTTTPPANGVPKERGIGASYKLQFIMTDGRTADGRGSLFPLKRIPHHLRTATQSTLQGKKKSSSARCKNGEVWVPCAYVCVCFWRIFQDDSVSQISNVNSHIFFHLCTVQSTWVCCSGLFKGL